MDPVDAALSFEAVKVSMNQNKDGMALRLNIHPSDVPRALLTDWVGTRYQVVMVRLGDDDQPEVSEETGEAIKAVKSAGLLCRNTAFHKFLGVAGEEEAAAEMRRILVVESRADLKEDPAALKRFKRLQARFLDWRERNPMDTAGR